MLVGGSEPSEASDVLKTDGWMSPWRSKDWPGEKNGRYYSRSTQDRYYLPYKREATR